jgi:glycosyltransferase involved in cell wall biosynthesis
VIRPLLEAAGFAVIVKPITPRERGARYRALLRRQFLRPDRALNIFIETLVPSEFHRARANVLIPNQEWFLDIDVSLLPLLRLIACRTRLSADLFANRGAPVAYVGFTGLDRYDPAVRQTGRILHVAGRSHFKGTAALLRVWQRHPEWPMLTAVHRTEVAPLLEGCPNVEQLTDHLDEAELARLQQEAWLQIQPSEVEGFGHSLLEAMSTGPLVVTLDAAPMNEIVTPERGVLVPWKRTVPMGFDQKYLIDEPALEGTIATLLAAGPAGNRERMAAARAWFGSNDVPFRRRFVDLFSRFLPAASE